MKFLTTILEKTLISLFAFCVGFVLLYVPHNYNRISTAEAGGGLPGAGATEPTQLVNMAQLLDVNVATTISSAADPITASMTSASFALDNVIDGVAWALAKGIVSQITASVVKWVNSGFQGSPAFITDMKGFLLDIADKEFGQYLDQIGGPYSFVCAPFKLDVQIALAISYDNARANGGVSGPSACTLTGVLANLDKFLDQTETFADGGGWDAWFQVTSNPEQYTPYGEYLTAEAQAGIKIANAKGEGINLASFGQGFLSSKVCEKVEGREHCTITTPGKVINEALTFQTSAGSRSLIAADEINEIISATFAQLSQKAITGTAGLLGLSGGTGYTDYSGGDPFIDQIINSDLTSNPQQILSLLQDSLTVETNYRAQAQLYEPQLYAYYNNILNNPTRRDDALDAYDEIPQLLTEIDVNRNLLIDLINQYNALPSFDPALLQEITNQYFSLRLHTKIEVDGQVSRWKTLIQ